MEQRVGIDIPGETRTVVVHFYNAQDHLLKSEVVADPANMEVPVPEDATRFTVTWAQDVKGKPTVLRAGSIIQASDPL